MSYEYTLDVRGLIHGIDRQIKTRREPIDVCDPNSTRSFPMCGGYVDAKADAGFSVVTCVRCLVLDLQRVRVCPWCKPPGTGIDTCESDGRCIHCGGSGTEYPTESEF